MITNTTLMEVQAKLMDAMTLLYLGDKDDELAQYLAANIIPIHEQIDIELMERAWAK